MFNYKYMFHDKYLEKMKMQRKKQMEMEKYLDSEDVVWDYILKRIDWDIEKNDQELKERLIKGFYLCRDKVYDFRNYEDCIYYFVDESIPIEEWNYYFNCILNSFIFEDKKEIKSYSLS